MKFDYDTYLTNVANILSGLGITKTILERAIGLKGEALTSVEKTDLDLDNIVNTNFGYSFDIFVVKLLTFPFQTSDIGLTNELQGCNVLFNLDATTTSIGVAKARAFPPLPASGPTIDAPNDNKYKFAVLGQDYSQLFTVSDNTTSVVADPRLGVANSIISFTSKTLDTTAKTYTLTIDSSNILDDNIGKHTITLTPSDGTDNGTALEYTLTVEAALAIDISDISTFIGIGGGNLGTATATKNVTWVLIGNDAAKFEIDTDGMVSVNNNTVAGEYTFNVKATSTTDASVKYSEAPKESAEITVNVLAQPTIAYNDVEASTGDNIEITGLLGNQVNSNHTVVMQLWNATNYDSIANSLSAPRHYVQTTDPNYTITYGYWSKTATTTYFPVGTLFKFKLVAFAGEASSYSANTKLITLIPDTGKTYTIPPINLTKINIIDHGVADGNKILAATSITNNWNSDDSLSVKVLKYRNTTISNSEDVPGRVNVFTSYNLHLDIGTTSAIYNIGYTIYETGSDPINEVVVGTTADHRAIPYVIWDSKFTVNPIGFNAPYYTITDSVNNITNNDSIKTYLERGKTYKFSGGTNTHPFYINSRAASTDVIPGNDHSSAYTQAAGSAMFYGISNGTKILTNKNEKYNPIRDAGESIYITIPSNFNGDLYYFCTAHSTMKDYFVYAKKPTISFTASDDLNANENNGIRKTTLTIGTVSIDNMDTDVTPSFNITGYNNDKFEIVNNAAVGEAAVWNLQFNSIDGAPGNYNLTIEVINTLVADSKSGINSSSLLVNFTVTVNNNVTITSSANGTTNEIFTITITSDEDLKDELTIDMINVTKGTKGDLVTVIDKKEYTLEITPASPDSGTIGISINKDNLQDALGNKPTENATFSQLFDTQPPTVTLTSSANGTTINEKFTITITSAELLKNELTIDMINVSNGTKGDLVTDTSKKIYTLEITPPTNESGDIQITINKDNLQDALGNKPTDDAAVTQGFDTQPPEVDITSSANGTTNEIFTITITSDEDLKDELTIDMINVTKGTKGDLVTVIDKKEYTLEITPASPDSGTIGISINKDNLQDALGNKPTENATFSQLFDTQPPTVTLTSSANGTTINEKFTITITSDEDLKDDLVIGDIGIDYGTKGTFTPVTVKRKYTLDITPPPNKNGTINITIDKDYLEDALGNKPTGHSTFQQLYGEDTQLPENSFTVEKINNRYVLRRNDTYFPQNLELERGIYYFNKLNSHDFRLYVNNQEFGTIETEVITVKIDSQTPTIYYHGTQDNTIGGSIHVLPPWLGHYDTIQTF